MSMPEPVVDVDRLVPVFAELGLGEPVLLTPLDGGSAATYRVARRADDAVVLKVYHDHRQPLTEQEPYAARLLAEYGLPITRFLAFDASRRLLPFRYAITNYLPGSAVATFIGAADVDDLYIQMGQLLRRLHNVALPHFGQFDREGIADPVATNQAFVARRWAFVLDRFRFYGAANRLADQLDAIVRDGADIIAQSSGPVFAHDDFQPNNVLAERDPNGRLRVSGLIDFGNARAADATYDLAKALFCSEHEAPGSTPSILKGYGRINHPRPEAALWLYTLIHRVTMWYWLRHIGVIRDAVPHNLLVDLQTMAAQKQL